MPGSSLITARGLYRYFGDRCAVRDISLQLHRGEVLGLLGPNGAGKTSTLRMLSGNLAPGAGRITILDADLLSDPRGAKRNIGYLPEQPPLYPDLTVEEYLRYCARLHGIARTGLVQAVGTVCERCGLDEVRGRLIGNLSKGYRQRVGIAQAIVHAPPVIILDEPTVGLDPLQIREIRDLIRELARDHGVLLSTHILPEVQAVCDRVQVIVAGRSVYDDVLHALPPREGLPVYALELAQPPAAEALAALFGVDGVKDTGEGRFLVTLQEEHALAALVAAAVEHGWGLRELAPERPSLEQIFMDLVYREQEAAA